MMTLKVWNTLSRETRIEIIRLCGHNAVEGLLEPYHHNFDFDAIGKRLKDILSCCYLRPSDKQIVVSIEVTPKYASNATKKVTASKTRRASVDYVVEVSKSFLDAVNILPDMLKKHGEGSLKQISVRPEMGWNYRIEGFYVSRGAVYVDVYWQGSSTDGTQNVSLDKLVASIKSGRDYIIPADSYFDGERTRTRHGDIRIDKNAVYDAIKLAATQCVKKK